MMMRFYAVREGYNVQVDFKDLSSFLFLLFTLGL